MQLNENTITIAKEKFVVRELTMRQLRPLLTQLQHDPEEGTVEIMKAAVFQNEKPLGEDVLDLGAATYIRLSQAVLAVNGMDQDDDDDAPGND